MLPQASDQAATQRSVQATDPTLATTQSGPAKLAPLSPEEEQHMKDLAASFRRRNNKKQ
ncbi:TPA: hypothetical protein ACH3X2_009874 [Trebouxia sp. C0005]